MKMLHAEMEKGLDRRSCSKVALVHNTVQKQVNSRSSFQREHETYQATLVKDIAKLQKQLKHEVDTRRALERALRRTLGALPRFSPGLTVEVQKLVAEVAVLEEEVVHLVEYIRILQKGLLHCEAFHASYPGQGSKLRSGTWSALADGSSVAPARQVGVTMDKRSILIANFLPLANENSPTRPVTRHGSPNSELPKRILSRSLSFRREVSAIM